MINLIIFIIKIVIAALLGGILGYGIQQTRFDSAIQAVMLVLIGATVFSGLYPRQGDNADTILFGVLLTGIIIGISILAVSALLQNKDSEQNFVVAGTIWSSAAVGVLVGTGSIIKALLLTGLLYYVLHYFPDVLRSSEDTDMEHQEDS